MGLPLPDPDCSESHDESEIGKSGNMYVVQLGEQHFSVSASVLQLLMQTASGGGDVAIDPNLFQLIQPLDEDDTDEDDLAQKNSIQSESALEVELLNNGHFASGFTSGSSSD